MFENGQEMFFRVREALDFAPDWVVALILLVLAATLALGLHAVLMQILHHLIGRRPYSQTLLTAVHGPTRLALVVLAFAVALPVAPLDDGTQQLFRKLLLLTVIGLIGWTVLRFLNTIAALWLLRFRLDSEDNLLARKHLTQVRILLRTLDTVIVGLTIGAALMTFDAVRQYGVSLFASAGVAGLVVGLAARPVLSNLLAGVQLAVTQPIRIDDAIVVENEFGNVEEITSTYVVVRLWDLRRLVVPLTYFIEKPFQNWTREGAAVMGSAMLYLDFSAPVDRIRQKAKELVEASPLWNRQVFNVQVTEWKQETIELRVLVSADNASANHDLRAELREKLLEFVGRDCPQALPRRRQESQPAAKESGDGRGAIRRGARSRPRSSADAAPET